MRAGLALLALAAVAVAGEPATAEAGRRLDIRIDADFGARPADVRAVALSAADSLWRHCPESRWRTPGFSLFLNRDHPICAYDHGSDGRIRIGVTTTGTYWSQLAFQFAHEFAHALAGHCDDWRGCWIRDRGANLWLEETLCETAALFALRSMAREWKTRPPYPNWKPYAASLASYAEDRLAEGRRELKPDADVTAWLRTKERHLRASSVHRELNLALAARLLPLFERQPSGWEAVTYLNRGRRRDPNLTLRQHLEDWRDACPPRHRAFVGELAALLGAPL